MASFTVHEHSIGRRGISTIDGNMEYVRQYLVISDTVDVSPDDVREASGIPVMTEPYPTNSRAIVVSKDPKPYGDERKVWMVEVKYSTSERAPSADIYWVRKPWNRKPQLRWGTYAVTEAVLEDRDGTVIQNSAGDRFDPSLVVEKHYPTLSITRYEQNYDINTALEYVDTVNELTILLAGLIVRAEGALMSRFEGTNTEVDGIACWQVTYEIMCAPSFMKKILDQGFYAWSGTPSVKAKVKIAGKDATEPVLLDGSGAELAFGGTPIWAEVHVYPKKDFGPLSLP